MPDKKLTLKDLFDTNDDEKLITLHLLEGDLDNLLMQFGKFERILMGMPMNNDDKYRFMRAICLIDMELHKQGSADCEVGTDGCGLLNTLSSFIRKFKHEIEHDPRYKLSDFEWRDK
jgi:hypothetical protein